jgi:hypothetical protein
MHRAFSAVVAVLLVGLASPAAAGGPPQLFSKTGQLAIDLEAEAVPFEVVLNPASGISHVVTLEPIGSGSDSAAWAATIPGMAGRSVLLVARRGIVFGTLGLPEGRFLVRSDGRGSGAVESVPAGGAQAEATPQIPPRLPPVPHKPQSKAAGSRIDVLVLYTPAVRSALGGTGAADAFAAAQIAELNLAFGNSAINLQANLAHSAEISYAESGDAATDLALLTNQGDGVLEQAHEMRDAHGADIVTLIVESGGSNAWVMTQLHPGFEAYAFSVVERSQAAAYYSTSHEIGHNLGSGHHRDNASTAGAFDYSFGYRIPGDFATVMAYPCVSEGLPDCPRVPYFSNPVIEYQGMPTGVPIGHARAADNATGFAATGALVAGFRDPAEPPAPHPDPDPTYCEGFEATIVGSEDADTLSGTEARDVIVGLGGNDTIRGGGGNDVICGGDGDDVIYGDAGKDHITGGPGADTIVGGAGNDTLDGEGGDDELLGGSGADRIDPGDGNDLVVGGKGKDRVYLSQGEDELDGGPGTDWIDARRADSAVTVDLKQGTSRGWPGMDSIAGFERIRGSSFGDELSGDSADNLLKGAGGDDVLVGRGGADQLRGGSGDDLLLGGDGNDTAKGGAGADRCSAETLKACEI